MKILLLNAGAKDYGATQEILLTIQNEIPTSESVSLICLGGKDLRFCAGCKTCYDTCKCFQDDDVAAILDAMNDSDIVVIAAPSYWADIPGQFKVFIDRCTPYSNTNPNPNRRMLKVGKKCYGIALRTGFRPFECEHIIDTIKHWCGHMGIEMAGSMFFCGINDREDIQQYKDLIREKTVEWISKSPAI